eukprot:4140219-Pleurochrysis_carterae.AAC.1
MQYNTTKKQFEALKAKLLGGASENAADMIHNDPGCAERLAEPAQEEGHGIGINSIPRRHQWRRRHQRQRRRH